MAQVGQGEIWMFSFPRPDKRRPVLILTRQEVISHLSTVSVAPITSTIRGIATEVTVGPEHGLKRVCAVNADHIVTVPKAGLRSFVGSVGPDKLRELCHAVEFAFGCPTGSP